LVADKNHQDDLERGRDEGRGADLLELAQAEFQAQREHEENDAEFGEGLDRILMGDECKGRGVRPDEHPSQDVAEHGGLLDLSKQHGHDRGGDHDHGKVLQERDVAGGGRSEQGKIRKEKMVHGNGAVAGCRHASRKR
jgi:hypothetical protein